MILYPEMGRKELQYYEGAGGMQKQRYSVRLTAIQLSCLAHDRRMMSAIMPLILQNRMEDLRYFVVVANEKFTTN